MKKILYTTLLILCFFQIKSQTTALNNLSVPFIDQAVSGCGQITGCGCSWSHNHGSQIDKTHYCGHTSASMIFAYYNDTLPTDQNIIEIAEWFANNYSNHAIHCGSGTPDPNYLKSLAINYGFTKTSAYGDDQNSILSYNDLISEVDSGYPIIAQVHTSFETSNGTHWVVIRGIDNNNVWINDPGKSSGQYVVSKTVFLQNWSTNGQNGAKHRCVIIRSHFINDKTEIYAGSFTNPKPFKVWFKIDGLNSNFTISNFTIGGNVINLPIITNQSYNPITKKGSFTVMLTSNQLIGFSNKSYNLRFDINSIYQFYGNKQIYFINPTQLTDVQSDDWFKPYIYAGVNMGLFKGKNTNSFSPSDNLSKAAMAKVIVLTALKLGLYEIDVSTTTNGTFADVTNKHWAFPYVQTLRNKSYITPTTNFNPENNITVAQFAKILCKGLGLNTSNINSYMINNGMGIISSKINYTCSDQTLQPYLNMINGIVNVSSNFNTLERLSNGMFPVTSNNIQSATILANGDNTVSRDLMSRVLINTYNYKLVTSSKSATNISNFTVIGDKFELTSTPSGNQPVSVSGNINMISGEVKDIGLNSDYQDGNPLYYYWTVDGGNLVSLYPNHKKVRFTAPVVSTNTDYHLYLLCGTSTGKINEAFITITVIPAGSGGTTVYPTQQASALSVTSVSINSATLQWSRGNGNYCIVTCDNTGSSSNPQANTVYMGNANLPSAPIISGSSTKVVYTGTNNSILVTGLTVGETYTFKVYEYNGNTTANVKYLFTNPASQSFLVANPNPMTANYIWSPSTIVAGQPVTFTNTSTNYTSINWTFNGANITSSTSNSINNVIFTNPGDFVVTLNATNTMTNESDYESKLHTIYSSNQLLPDLVAKTISVTPTPLLTSNGYIHVNCSFVNSGFNPSGNINLKIYFSNNNSISTDDILIETAMYNGPISNGSEVLYDDNINLNFGLSSGTYYILANIDGDNTENEINENNNIASTQINIAQSLPDLIIQSLTVTPITVSSQNNISLTAQIKNIGTSNTFSSAIGYIQLYFSTDTILSSNDILHNQGLYYGSTININQVVSINNSLPLPIGIPDGNYYIIAKINYMNELELNYSNNVIITSLFTILSPNQPTIQANNFKLSNITDNSARLSWINGNGQNRIVIASTQTCIVPNDGVSYVSNSSFILAPEITTGNKVVYNGNGNFVDITGLTTNTTYYFTVIEYNGIGSQINYLQTPSDENGYSSHQIFAEICINSISNLGWVSQLVPSSFDDLFFINDTVGYGVMCCGRTCKTVDGGKTWVLRKIPSNTSSLSTLFFINENVGWFAGGRNGVIWKTIDGGNTFILQTTNTIRSISDIYFVNSTIGYAAFKGSNSFDGTGAILKTIDGGNNWSVVYQSPQLLNSIYFANENIGWSVGRYGIILKTTNGGASWTTQSSGLSITPDFNTCYFINSNIGFVSGFGGGKIFKTIDGGTTWSIAKQSGNDLIFSIHFANSMCGYAVGGYEIHKTVDGGQSWISSSISNYSKSVFCVNPSLVFIGCDEGIMKSLSGGQNQTISPPSVSQNYCTPAVFNIPISIVGNFNSGNTFKAELSDYNGFFTNPIIIGQTDTNMNGIIQCAIPTGLAIGNNYKIRITANNPVTIGGESNIFSINQTPIVSINGLVDSCLTTSPDITLVSLASPAGGTFTVNGNPTTIFSPSTLGAGTYNIIYTYSNGVCYSSAYKTVTVSVPNAINIANLYTSQYCAGSTINVSYTLQGSFNTGNQFNVELSNNMGSFANPTIINSISSIVSGSIVCTLPVYSLSGNGYKIRITSTSPNITSDESNVFTINAANLVSVSISTNNSSVCANTPVVFTATNTNGSNPNYQWKVNGLNVGANNSIYTNSTLQNGDIVSVQLTSSTNCAYPTIVNSNTIAMSIIQNVSPTIFIESDLSEICPNDTINYWAYIENEGSNPIYKWFINGIDVNKNNVYTSIDTLTQNSNIRVFMTSNAECLLNDTVSSNVLQINTNPIPTAAGIVSGNAAVCQGQNSVNYTVPTIANATSYLWTLPNGATGSSATNSIAVNYGTAAISGNITVKGINSCGEGTISTLPIIVNALPTAAGTLSGNAMVCQGQNSVNYTVPSIANATNYIWSLPSGASGSSTTNSIAVNYGTTANSGNITVKGTNSCGEGTIATLPITVNALPIAAGTLSGTATVCQGQNSVNYTVPSIANATNYIWSLPSGASGSSTTNSITVNFGTTANSGNITVKGTNSCGEGSISTLPIIVNLLPFAANSISGITTVCQGQTNVIYTVPAITNASSYNWTLPIGVTGNSNSNSISVNYLTSISSGDIKVKGTNLCGNGLESILQINITPIPQTPILIQNGNTLYSSSTIGNQWFYIPIGILSNANGQTYIPQQIGDYFVIVTINGCSSDSSNIIHYDNTGIGVIRNNQNIKVYPNPFRNELIVELQGNKEILELEIINSIGQPIFKVKLLEKITISTSSFIPGVYLIKLNNGKTFEFKKIVKE